MLLGWPAHSHCPKRGLTHNASDTYVARALLACCVRAACCARTSVHHVRSVGGRAVRPLHAVCGTGRDAYRMHAMCACARMRARMLPSRPAGDPRNPPGLVLVCARCVLHGMRAPRGGRCTVAARGARVPTLRVGARSAACMRAGNAALCEARSVPLPCCRGAVLQHRCCVPLCSVGLLLAQYLLGGGVD
jgi:hypothetical protein